MIDQRIYLAIYAIQGRLCVSGLFDDRQRVSIREICQGVLDDCDKPFYRRQTLTNPQTYQAVGKSL